MLCCDEYVMNGAPLLTASTTDLMPPAPALAPVEHQVLAIGVNLLC